MLFEVFDERQGRFCIIDGHLAFVMGGSESLFVVVDKVTYTCLFLTFC